MDWLYEYDEERHIQMERKEWREIGRKEGRKDIILNALENGKSSNEVAEFVKIPLEEVLEVEGKMFQEA